MNNWKYELCSNIIELAKDVYHENGDHDIKLVPEQTFKDRESLTVGDLKKQIASLCDDLPIRSVNDDRYLSGFYNTVDIGNEKDAIYLVPDYKSIRHKS